MIRACSIRPLLVAASCLAAIGLAACGSSGSGTSSSTVAGKGSFRVAVLSVGSDTDGSFGQAWGEATKLTASQDGVQAVHVGDLNTPDQYLAQGASYASAGYNLVVLAHGAMAPVAQQLAQRFPKTEFCVAPVPTPPPGPRPANDCVFDVEQQVGAFRAGLLAGLVTKTNVVASNMSLPIPAIWRQAEAFELGAKCVNPKVRVLNVVTNNDTDPSVTQTATQAQIRQGADVIMGATGTAMPGIFEAAAQAPGRYAIGQYVDSASVAPKVVLASNIVNFQQVLPLVVKQAMNGGLPRSYFHAYGLDTPVPVGYLAMNKALTAHFSNAELRANARVQAELTNGKIRIPPVGEIDSAGSASKIDVASLGCRPLR